MKEIDLQKLDRLIYRELFGKAQLELADQIYSPTFVGHNPPQPDLLGPEAIKEQVRRTHAAYVDIEYEVADQLRDGNKGLTRWLMRGSRRSTTGGQPDPSVHLGGLTLIHCVDGKVQEEWTYWSQLS